MQRLWNVDPEHPTTYLRIISDLESAVRMLKCIDTPTEEIEHLQAIKRRLYRSYFQMMKCPSRDKNGDRVKEWQGVNPARGKG